MESFPSCVVGGVVFSLLGIFWILQNSFNTARQFYDSRGIVWSPPKAVRTFNKFPVEGVLITLFTICAFLTDQVYPKWKWRMFDENSELVNQSEWLNCTIYAAFFLYGICKALATKSIQGVWYYVPLYRCFAFSVQAVLIVFLLIDSNEDRTRLNFRMHLLHVMTILPVVIAGMLEGWWDDPLLVRLRCFTTLLQGTWLFQMAFTLYLPKSDSSETKDLNDYAVGIQYASEDITPVFKRDENDPALTTFYTMVFAWHSMLSVIVITFCHAAMRAVAVCIYRKVLEQKVANGEDLGMLTAGDNEV